MSTARRLRALRPTADLDARRQGTARPAAVVTQRRCAPCAWRSLRLRIGAAAPAESKEDAADAGATVHAQLDCVDTWSTDKIETFAPAAEQMIVVRNVGKPHWKVFRTMSILLLTSRGAAWDWLLYAAGHKETVSL